MTSLGRMPPDAAPAAMLHPRYDAGVLGAKLATSLVVLASSVAHAQSVDVQDLPPLPLATEAESTSSLVHAASEANEEVVVGAAKREQSLGNVASAVTVVSADRIRRFGYRTERDRSRIHLAINRIESRSVRTASMKVIGAREISLRNGARCVHRDNRRLY